MLSPVAFILSRVSWVCGFNLRSYSFGIFWQMNIIKSANIKSADGLTQQSTNCSSCQACSKASTWESQFVIPLSQFVCCVSCIQIITPWYTMIHHDTPWYTMIHHDTPWYTMIHHDTPWYTGSSTTWPIASPLPAYRQGSPPVCVVALQQLDALLVPTSTKRCVMLSRFDFTSGCWIWELGIWMVLVKCWNNMLTRTWAVVAQHRVARDIDKLPAFDNSSVSGQQHETSLALAAAPSVWYENIRKL